ncbi:interleukin-18 receptor accessory protein-like isoform X1 [Scophthalmus maximus]|uniref:interleukin-18 receptor accessory protein-like isoform X1 n=1 Tax=Scophthalmus maximus TaxID=52904 RepID=UPI0015E0F8CF|nr:interleukin-18 receptor accessory protein-like isoform X1 [Scophthalmus maximus]
MKTGHVLFLSIFPIVLEGCCVGNHPEKHTGLQQDAAHQHYRAVEGESFMMPCITSVNGHINVVWSRTGDEGPSFDCGKVFPADAKHSGKYSCLTGSRELFLHLQVVERTSLRCFQSEESKVELINSAGGEIPCPGRNCSDNTDVRWYKGNVSVSELSRDTCVKDGLLHLCEVKGKYDAGVYFCDRRTVEQGVTWTIRRAVEAKVIPHKTTSNHPRIMYPVDNMKEEVELGLAHNLTCEVLFPYENTFSAEVLWYRNVGGNKESMTLLDMERQQQRSPIMEEYEIIQRSIIKEVTQKHLEHTYTCVASNTVGKHSVTIRLKRKIQVKWSLVGYSIAPLVLVAGLGIILHVKWLELQIIYRSHFQHGKHDGDEKKFDVFLSYVWSPTSADLEGGRTLSSPSGPDTAEEACLSSMDPLNTEEGEAPQRPLHVLLQQVLEERWGYRLCLLERDFLPGGAYTNDVVLAIQRSQMLICLLSADYLCSSNAVFVLETGVQALLQNSAVKILLIWTGRDAASLVQDPPLPSLVQRALKVLPRLNWTSGKPARATEEFLRFLRKAMPDRRVKLVSLV